MPRLSIIIVTFNSIREIDACLRSLTDGVRVDREVLIVDNASSDGTTAHIRQHWPGIRLMDLGANLGFARATNIGIQQTFGELVLILNPDTVVHPGTIDGLVAALDADPHTAIAGPRIVDTRGRAELSFGAMISPLAEVRQKVLVKGGQGILRPLVERLTRRTRYVDWVSGACMLARRADLEVVGLFDERFFMYTEDVDLCASVRSRGRRVLFAGHLEITHHRGASRASTPDAIEAAYRRSRVAFYEKHHPRWAPILRTYLRLFAQK